ncbi:di-trans,poly-cis-decaprenylcistransferase [bacterium CG10_46_32]|nr:MAG: di-trans,poly-cis-decaprenylcistransferase [bacterium CG10_46_32]
MRGTDKAQVPHHVVIIPDGNRRWARAKGWQPWVGHRAALQNKRMREIFKECRRSGIQYLSLWGFSTENWNRDKKEIEYLFGIFKEFVGTLSKNLHEDKIRFRLFGRRDRFPKDIIAICEQLEVDAEKYTNLNFQLCLDSGGRDDLVRAFNRMAEDGITKVDEQVISTYLDSNGIPDPDLIIRTSGEQRTSGIMAYQSVYAELYFTSVHFPDFGGEQFRLAILDYASRVRRFGGTAQEDVAGIAAGELIDPGLEKV